VVVSQPTAKIRKPAMIASIADAMADQWGNL